MPQQTEKKPRTSTLLQRLFKTADLKDFLDRNGADMQAPAFHEHIAQLCDDIGEKKESIIKRASIERTYGHQLFNGTRRPSRDKAIQLAIGFGLDVEGTQKLLQIAEKSLLYPRIKRDAAVIYCINHKYGIIETQSMLHDLTLHMLGDE
jgi:hypothetical protein